MRSTFASLATASLMASQFAGAIDLNVDSTSSIKSAAATIANDLIAYYTPANKALLPTTPLYYWWEAGAMFGTMISYSYLTGDTTHDEVVASAIYSQASNTTDFMMLSTLAGQLGNDDQAFWGLTAMSAAEHGLRIPSGAPEDIWLKLASNTFNDLIGRWNTSYCNGGIKWQFQPQNNGYNYKSSIANGATLQLGARLALLTGNDTYAQKATMVWDWMSAVGFVNDNFEVFDGAGDYPGNCSAVDQDQWSYNSAALLGGAAAMANYTAGKGSPDAGTWTNRTKGLWTTATNTFFYNGTVIYESKCEDAGSCDLDEWSFKAYLARWAAFAGQVVPSIMDDVQSKLASSAVAAAQSCTGNGTSACGTKWYDNGYDNNTGVGQEMSALEVIVGLLAPKVPFVPGSGASDSGDGGASSSSSSAVTSTAAATSTLPATSTSDPTTVSSTAAAATVAPATGANAGPGLGQTEPVKIGDDGIPYSTAPVS